MAEEQQEKPQPIKVIRSGDEPRYYANNTEIGMSSYDISLRFAVIDHADAEGLHVLNRAIVTMSLHHAKAVADILSTYVAQFERDHGALSTTIQTIRPDVPRDTVAVKIDPNAK